jgi:hypothetical protein
MLMMQQSKYKKLLLAVFGILLLLGIGIAIQKSTKNNTASNNIEDLTDGEKINYIGTFHNSPTTNGLKAYRSSEMGISFKYPTGYLLFENKNSFEGVDYRSLTIAPKEPMLEAISRARANSGGEGPASINISFISNPKSLALEQWMRANSAHSNFNPDADPGAASSLASTTVAGTSALMWHSDLGLYANDYVAFLYGDWVVVVSAADMGAMIPIQDFQAVLSTIQLRSL